LEGLEDGKDQTGEKGKNLRRRRMVKALTDIGKAIKVAVLTAFILIACKKMRLSLWRMTYQPRLFS